MSLRFNKATYKKKQDFKVRIYMTDWESNPRRRLIKEYYFLGQGL